MNVNLHDVQGDLTVVAVSAVLTCHPVNDMIDGTKHLVTLEVLHF